MDSVTEAALAQLKAQGWKPVAQYRGPPGSGKTTRANRRANELRAQGWQTKILHRDSFDEIWVRKAS